MIFRPTPIQLEQKSPAKMMMTLIEVAILLRLLTDINLSKKHLLTSKLNLFVTVLKTKLVISAFLLSRKKPLVVYVRPLRK